MSNSASRKVLTIREKQFLFERAYKKMISHHIAQMTSPSHACTLPTPVSPSSNTQTCINLSTNAIIDRDTENNEQIVSNEYNSIKSLQSSYLLTPTSDLNTTINGKINSMNIASTSFYPSHLEKAKMAELLDVSLSSLGKWMTKVREDVRNMTDDGTIDEQHVSGDVIHNQYNSSNWDEMVSFQKSNEKSLFFKSWPRVRLLIKSLVMKKYSPLTESENVSIEKSTNVQLIREISRLVKLSGFSRRKIVSYLYYAKDPSGVLEAKNKEIIRTLWNERQSEKKSISSEDIQLLKEQTKCSRQQILDYVKFLKDPPGTFTEDNRAFIKKYYKEWKDIQKHGGTSRRLLDFLHSSTSLSRRQILSYLSWLHLKNLVPLTSEQKSQILYILENMKKVDLEILKDNSNAFTKASRISIEHSIADSVNAHPIQVRKFLKQLYNPSKISKSNRNIVEQYLKLHGVKLTEQDFEKLKELSGLQSRQIKYIVKVFKESPGVITPLKKQAITIRINQEKDWEKNGKKLISELSSEFELSSEQIRSIIRSHRSNISHLSPYQLKVLMNHIKMNILPQVYNRRLSSSNTNYNSINLNMYNNILHSKEIEMCCDMIESELGEEYKLNSFQLRNILKRISQQSSGPIHLWQKKAIKEWISKTPNREISSESIQSLIKETGLNIFQVHYLIRKFTDIRGEITRAKKVYVQHFVASNPPPYTSQDRQNLQNHLKLSRQQVYGLLRQATEKTNDILYHGTLDQKKYMILQKWFSKHDCYPKKEEMENLCKSLSLSPSQIRNVISKLIDPPGEITFSKKDFLQNWFEEKQRMPTSEEVKEIQKEIRLSKKQIRNILTHFKARKYKYNHNISQYRRS